MAEPLDVPDLTLDEALKRLKLGGDMHMLVGLPEGSIRVAMQVRNDVLTLATVGVDKQLHSADCLLTSEQRVLQTLIALLENASGRRDRRVSNGL